MRRIVLAAGHTHHGVKFDARAGERHVELGGDAAGAAKRHRYLRAEFAHDELLGVVDGPAFGVEPLLGIGELVGDGWGRVAVDLHDEVVGDDAGLVGGCAGHRVADLEQVRFGVEAEHDADAAEAAFAVGLEVLELLLVEVFGVRVELPQPAVDHVFDELLAVVVREFAVVVGIDLGEHVDDLANEDVVLVWGRRAVADGEPNEHEGGNDQKPGEVAKGHSF